MKKAKVNMTINVSDDFEVGECAKCPIHSESCFSTHIYSETKISCLLNCTPVNCPITIEEEKK